MPKLTKAKILKCLETCSGYEGLEISFIGDVIFSSYNYKVTLKKSNDIATFFTKEERGMHFVKLRIDAGLFIPSGLVDYFMNLLFLNRTIPGALSEDNPNLIGPNTIVDMCSSYDEIEIMGKRFSHQPHSMNEWTEIKDYSGRRSITKWKTNGFTSLNIPDYNIFPPPTKLIKVVDDWTTPKRYWGYGIEEHHQLRDTAFAEIRFNVETPIYSFELISDDNKFSLCVNFVCSDGSKQTIDEASLLDLRGSFGHALFYCH